MEFVITRHAREQMAERDVTADQIDAVLSNPRWTPFATSNTRYDGVVADGRRLVVILAERYEVPRVVTVWWYDEERERDG